MAVLITLCVLVLALLVALAVLIVPLLTCLFLISVMIRIPPNIKISGQ